MSVAGGGWGQQRPKRPGTAAKAAGYGGIAAVWRATGVATSTIGLGYANWLRRRPLRPVGSLAQVAAASRPSRLIPT